MTSIDALKQNPIFFYTDVKIAPYGQGSSMRVWTNMRAYLDLGFEVILNHYHSPDGALINPVNLPQKNIKVFELIMEPIKPNRLDLLLYCLGFSKKEVLDVLFPIRHLVVDSVRKNQRLYPDAIHHFEYDQFASAAVHYKDLNAVWSHHDINSIRIPLLWKMRERADVLNSSTFSRVVRKRRLKTAEKWISKHTSLILNIASHEHNEFRNGRGFNNAELFPMSWPYENPPQRKRKWIENGILRLFHLGSIDGFVGYDSLKYILQDVFPLLSREVIKRLELIIVGKKSNSFYSKELFSLAEPYSNVKFLGYVDDIREIYSQMDLQLVGGVRATGLRTRIIESFAYGVPVLSTTVSAMGAHSLKHGENILLAENSEEFAQNIVEILNNPDKLVKISSNARKTYINHYSRDCAAKRLSQLLEAYF